MLTRHWNLHWIDGWDRAGVWAGTSVHLYLCVRVTREALHTSSLTHFLPNTICKGEMEAILRFCFGLLLLKPWLLLLLHVTSIHVARTAYIQHEYFMNIGEAIAMWDTMHISDDTWLMCLEIWVYYVLATFIYYQKAGLFPYCTD